MSSVTDINYAVVYASSSDGSKYAEDMTRDLEDRIGWISKKNCSYPQQVILQLETDCNVVKIVLLSHTTFIARRIDFYIAEDRPKDPRTANYKYLGYTEFQEAKTQKPERRTVFCDGNGRLVLLKFQSNHKDTDNPKNQVGLKNIKVMGYHGVSKTKVARRPITPVASLNNAAVQPEPPQQTGIITNLMDHPSVRVPEQPTTVRAKDPLMEVRTTIKLMEKRKSEAVMKDNIYEARMCATALECLTKAEEDILEANAERRRALDYGDTALGNTYLLKAQEIRDACLATIAVDDVVEPTTPQQPILSRPVSLPPAQQQFVVAPPPWEGNSRKDSPVRPRRSKSSSHKPRKSRASRSSRRQSRSDSEESRKGKSKKKQKEESSSETDSEKKRKKKKSSRKKQSSDSEDSEADRKKKSKLKGRRKKEESSEEESEESSSPDRRKKKTSKKISSRRKDTDDEVSDREQRKSKGSKKTKNKKKDSESQANLSDD